VMWRVERLRRPLTFSDRCAAAQHGWGGAPPRVVLSAEGALLTAAYVASACVVGRGPFLH
jgi:hypothetical protein